MGGKRTLCFQLYVTDNCELTASTLKLGEGLRAVSNRLSATMRTAIVHFEPVGFDRATGKSARPS